MLKGLKKIMSVIVIALMLVLTMASGVSAYPGGSNDSHGKKSYVALGDSISYGMSASVIKYIHGKPIYNGYAQKFAASLKNYSFTNLSCPGYTTKNLIEVIDANCKLLKNADIITISIGSNNLIGPVIKAMGSLYGLNPDDPVYAKDPTGQTFLKALAAKIREDVNKGVDPVITVAQLNDPANPKGIEFKNNLAAGISNFTSDWPKIINKIRKLNPKSEIYVTNLYDPLKPSSESDLLDMILNFVYQKMDIRITGMNSIINTDSTKFGYKVVDVYSVFVKTPGVLSFDIRSALGAINNPPYFLKYIDPHPTDIGHEAIFQALLAVRAGTKH